MKGIGKKRSTMTQSLRVTGEGGGIFKGWLVKTSTMPMPRWCKVMFITEMDYNEVEAER